MTKKSSRESLIDSIMSTKYKSDDIKYEATNRAFLESLSTTELMRFSEDEFDPRGEVMDFDFDDEELY